MKITVVADSPSSKLLTTNDLEYGDIGVGFNGGFYMKIWQHGEVRYIVELCSGGRSTYETESRSINLKEILSKGSGKKVMLEL